MLQLICRKPRRQCFCLVVYFFASRPNYQAVTSTAASYMCRLVLLGLDINSHWPTSQSCSYISRICVFLMYVKPIYFYHVGFSPACGSTII